MRSACLLGLTGGIGSGKSTVAAMLARLGAEVMDADAVSRSLTAPNGLAMPDIAQAFGSEFVTPEGALDRIRMRTLAFADASARKRLESILHPLVNQVIWQQADQALASGQRCLVFDVPLLAESTRWRARMHQILVVDCMPDTQIARVVVRSALAPSAVQAIMTSQASRCQRLRCADAVVFNDGIDLHELQQQIEALAPGFGLSLTTTSAHSTSA